MVLPITMTIAAACALLTLWLSIRTGQVRGQTKINIGDGGDPRLIARMRAQSNFVEYTPFFLLLLTLVESAKGTHLWLWGVAIAYVLARVAHPFGMDRPSPNVLRTGGAVVTMLGLLVLAVYALVIVYSGLKVA
jgi:uncharacterized protein